MLSSARTLNFIPRIRVKKINGAHWSTFCHFGSYEEAHTQALQIKRVKSLRNVASDATHAFLLPPLLEPDVQGWRQK
jgi:hypothetical protein